MKILDYLKWRAEHKAEQKRLAWERKRAEENENLKPRIAQLTAEIEGLKQKKRAYEIARPNLMLSNHIDIGQIAEEIGEKQGKIDALQVRLEKVEGKQSE